MMNGDIRTLTRSKEWTDKEKKREGSSWQRQLEVTMKLGDKRQI